MSAERTPYAATEAACVASRRSDHRSHASTSVIRDQTPSFRLPAYATDRIRIYVRASAGGVWSRVTEVEARSVPPTPPIDPAISKASVNP